jgi:predicted nucleotide-binding protein (sugar kinase/HSP70/actin superfamily)
MGTLSIALAGAIRRLGGEVIIAPYNSKKTLSLGTRHSPEAVCLPYKLVLGNYIEAIELGAEALLMLDSPGICRLGQYSRSCRGALKDLGYGDVKFINFDLYKGKLIELATKFGEATGNKNYLDMMAAVNLALVKIDVVDQLDHSLAYYRAREIKPGIADTKYKKGLKAIDAAMTPKDTKKALQYGLEELKSTPVDADREVLNVDLTGEIFVVLDPFSNMDIEKELGKLGVHVHRRLNLSDWTKTFLMPRWLRKDETHEEIATRYAKNYLSRDVGGDAIESVGDTARAGANKTDGVVHLLPFTCMPEIVSQNILPNVRNVEDIPYLSLVLDEQMGKAGFITRLEAFVDLLKRRKNSLKLSEAKQASNLKAEPDEKVPELVGAK